MSETIQEAAAIADREEMHVAGLILARVLARAARARPDLRLRGPLAIDAGGMVATVVPAAGGHVVRRGLAEPLSAVVRAPLATLVSLAAGRSIALALLRGDLRARGDPRTLWTFRALFRASRTAP